MPSQIIVPPQGTTNQALTGIGHFYRTLFTPPQGFIIGGIIDPWFNTNWMFRIPLTVNPTQVPSTQTDFPMLIFSTFPTLIGSLEAELRFADSNAVQLEYEIQKFDNSTGELIAWVKKPTLNDDDRIYVYYDNPTALDEQNPPAVWDINYKARYSMKDNSLLDSTINAQHLTHFGSSDIVGKIGDAQSYGSSTSHYAIRNPFVGFPSAEITVEYWAKTNGTGDGMVSYATGGNSNSFLLIRQDSTNLSLNFGTIVTGIIFNDAVFHHIVIQWRSSDGTVFAYVDGTLSFSDVNFNIGHAIPTGGSLVLAQDQDAVGGGFQSSMSYGGTLDEVRLSDAFRSADYVKTTYNNQNDPNLFYSIGSVQTVPDVPGEINGWADSLGNQLIDDLANSVVFEI